MTGVKFFSDLIGIIMIFPFRLFFNVDYDVNGFLIVSHLALLNKSLLFMVYYFLNVVLDSLCLLIFYSES